MLSDAYTSMSREERQALLHEGVSTTTTLSAYGAFKSVSIAYALSGSSQLRLYLTTRTIVSLLVMRRLSSEEPLA